MLGRWVNVALGAWLGTASWLLADPGSMARVNDLSVGIAVALLAVIAAPGIAPGFANILVGTWLMLAPSVFGYGAQANAVNDIAVGFAVIALTLHPNLRVRARPRVMRA